MDKVASVSREPLTTRRRRRLLLSPPLNFQSLGKLVLGGSGPLTRRIRSDGLRCVSGPLFCSECLAFGVRLYRWHEALMPLVLGNCYCNGCVITVVGQAQLSQLVPAIWGNGGLLPAGAITYGELQSFLELSEVDRSGADFLDVRVYG